MQAPSPPPPPALGVVVPTNANADSKDRFQCKLCGKKFRQKRTLSNHRLSHSGQRPYECKVCGKRFFWSGSLSRHNRIHTGEKPYKCNVCQKQFTQSGTLNRHLRTHTGEKPYQCKYCPRRFSTNSNLAQHLKTHEKNGTCTTVPNAHMTAPLGNWSTSMMTPAIAFSQNSGNAAAVERILHGDTRKPAFLAAAVPDSKTARALARVTEAASRARNSGGLQAINNADHAWSSCANPSPSTPHKLNTIPSLALENTLPLPPLSNKLDYQEHEHDDHVNLHVDSLGQCDLPPLALGLGSSTPFFNPSTMTMEPLGSLTPTHTPKTPKSPLQHTRNGVTQQAGSVCWNSSPKNIPLRIWDMEKNVVVGGDGLYECMWCNVRCAQRDSLLSHFLTHFGDIA